MQKIGWQCIYIRLVFVKYPLKRNTERTVDVEAVGQMVTEEEA